MVALKSGVRLYLVFPGEALDDLVKDLHAQLRADDLTPPKIHYDLCLVAVFDKAVDIPDLELKIVLVDLGSDLHLFEVYGLLLGVLLMQLVFVFAEIKDLAYRRHRRGRNLNKIKLPLFGNVKCLADRHDAKLATVAVNDPDLLGPDLLVHSDVFAYVPVTDVFTS